jgi:hypothetical protein
VLGSTTPAPADYLGDGALPVSFTEDQNGGSVTVTYYAVGPEKDYFTGFGIPNVWDGNGKTVVVDTDCQAASTGSIKVKKKVDMGNGYIDDNPSQHGFLWGIDNETPARAMGSISEQLVVGDYDITENTVPGFEYVGWYTGEGNCVDDLNGTGLPQDITVRKDSTRHITLCNKKIEQPKGSIKVIKDVDDGTDEQDFDFRFSADGGLRGADFKLDDDGDNSNALSNTELITPLEAGEYSVEELVPNGWELEDIDCDAEDWSRVGDKATIDLMAGEHVTCTFLNEKDEPGGGGCQVDCGEKPKGSISGFKLNDANGNAMEDTGEEKLSNWTIQLWGECRQVALFANLSTIAANLPTNDCYELYEETVTDQNGNYVFDDLEAGTYFVCEVMQDGWTRTFPADSDCHEVEVSTGEDCIANFANKAKAPGNVLGEVTPTPPAPQVLANTGTPFIQGLLVGMSILGAASGITYLSRKKQYQV